VHSLTPITALGGSEPRVDQLGHEAKCRQHLKDVIGAVPGPGKAQLHDPEAGFWMGPDQWLVGAPFETHEDLAAQLKARFGDTASITEQTDAWVCYDRRGDGMEAAVELLCNVNIRAMNTGDAQRTSIHHLGCYILRRDPADWVRILGPRASAGSLHHAILTAMKSAL